MGQDISDEKLKELISVVDSDGGGEIQFEEFLQLIQL